jgi:tight adherence protein C
MHQQLDLNTIKMWIISGLAGVSFSLFVYYFLWLSIQIQYVILADGRRLERSLPLLLRAVLPFTTFFPNWFRGKSFQKHFDGVDLRIISSGYDGLISGRELRLCQLWLGTAGLFVGLILLKDPSSTMVTTWLIFVLIMFFYPEVWLRGAIAQRHKVIQRGLPFVLDLLTLCVEAGLDFMSALARIVERRKMDALTEEMMRVFHNIKLGKTRRQALREMRDRIAHPDVTSVVNALIQADELGVSLGTILRIQADQMRTKRFQRAEKLANEAPTKMLLPLVFIFIAALIILIGPVLLQIFQRLF